jgi:putative nucleotidyltransferase with HDIG domain
VIAPAEVAARVRALPALSVAAVRLHALVADPRSSAADFEAVIRPDPSLTANLLRVANSAYFAPRSRVETARQAVALLGVRRICDVAAAAALAPILPRRLPGYEIDAAGFWTHCVAVAVLAERLATGSGAGAPDVVFTAGLLHDLGKLAVCAFVSGESGAILARFRGGEGFASAEREVLGVDHAEVGALVAEAWALPIAVVQAARWHHRPAAAGAAGAGAVRLAALVHVADALAHSLGLGADAGELGREVDADAVRTAGVSVQALERVASESLETIHDLARLLGGAGGAR